MDQNYNNQPQQAPKGFAIAALVLGIVSIVFCCLWYISIPTGVVGIILGVMGRKKCTTAQGMATAGLVLSIIGAVLSILLITILASFLASLSASF